MTQQGDLRLLKAGLPIMQVMRDIVEACSAWSLAFQRTAAAGAALHIDICKLPASHSAPPKSR